MSPAIVPTAGRLYGRLPANTARTTRFVAFDKVSAAAVSAPSNLEEDGRAYEDPGDVVVLAFVTAGTVASTVGRETIIRTRGDMAMSHLTRVEKVGMTLDFRSVSLRFASDLLHASSREIDWLMQRRFGQSEAIPRLLGMMCRELLAPSSKMGTGTTTALTQSIVNLCAGLFDDALGKNSPPERKSRNLVTQALNYIEINASCPSIAPQRVADALQVSVRTLHKAFEGEPESVAQSILAARLAKAERMLQAETTSIENIAAQCGFASPSAFSRAFRRAYDVTPRDWRRSRAERE